jgi:ABC-type lipoprotein release transport system permease subunit
MRTGVTTAQARANLQPIVAATDKALAADRNTIGEDISLLGVQRPAQIVNYRTVGAAPLILAAGLAVGAIVALLLTLTASVRRRRRDLALLKTLGFTRRQLAATVASQATVAALVGIVIGVPTGVIAGRWLWTLFAREIAAVPSPTVPGAWIAAVALATLVLANLVGAIPGRQAARTPSALLLQAE